MSRKWTLLKTTVLAAMVVFGTVIGCSDDDAPTDPGGPGGGGSVTLPASWGGTWVTSEGALPLARGNGFEVTVDALCGGLTAEDIILDEDAGTCTGSWTDTDADVTCTSSTEIFTDCTETRTVRVLLTRTDDEFSGTITESVTYSSGCELQDEEGGISMSATRVNADQIGCADLAEGLPASWGGTWNVITTGGGNRGEGDLLCPGDTVEEMFFSGESGDIDVIGGFTETTLEAFATFEVTNGTECTTIETTTIQITRDGSSLTGTGVVRTYTLQTPGTTTTCVDDGDVAVENVTLTGTRTSTDVSACSGGTSEGGLPQELAGTWNIEYEIRDEDTQVIVDEGTENGVVLEAGDPIDEIFFGDFIPPTGTRTCTPTTFNGGVFNGSCTYEWSPFPGCAVTTPMDVTGQLNGNVFTFSGGLGYVASPPECIPEIELNLTGTATRVGFRRGSLSFLHR